jgi:hypothetical protein
MKVYLDDSTLYVYINPHKFYNKYMFLGVCQTIHVLLCFFCSIKGFVLFCSIKENVLEHRVIRWFYPTNNAQHGLLYERVVSFDLFLPHHHIYLVPSRKIAIQNNCFALFFYFYLLFTHSLHSVVIIACFVSSCFHLNLLIVPSDLRILLDKIQYHWSTQLIIRAASTVVRNFSLTS